MLTYKESQRLPMGLRTFVRNVMSAVPGGVQQEIVYPASVTNIATTGPGIGARDVVAKASEMASRCPGTPLALAGYSQGGMVMTVAINRGVALPVSSVVLWGSPYHRARTEMDQGTTRRGRGIFAGRSTVPDQFKAITREWCDANDIFCDGGFSLPVHLAYGRNSATPRSAEFTVQQLRGAIASAAAGNRPAAASATSGRVRAGPENDGQGRLIVFPLFENSTT